MPGNIDVPGLLKTLQIDAERRGRDWWAPCPAHPEKDPSWHINAEGSHHCFGCQFEGGPAELVGVKMGLPLNEALRWLRDNTTRARVDVPSEVRVRLRRGMLGRFRLPEYVTGPLDSWVTPARRYALRRGLTDAQVNKWHIGYCVQGRLFGRLVFPILSGDAAVGYHARTFTEDTKRYLYPARNEGADVGAIFGQNGWTDATTEDELTLTEGALDALACERAGATFVGAIGGSEPNAHQLLRMARWRRVAVASDGDAAGDKVHRKVLQALHRTSTIRRVPIPTGRDACDLPEDDLRELLWRS